MLHWVHSGAFVILFLTGMILFIPALGSLLENGWIRVVHRVAASVFIIIPLLYLIIKPKSAIRGIKLAFTWGNDDIGWLKALPGYYFKGDYSKTPPQGEMNTGQKAWWLIVMVFGLLFAISGLTMWFAITTASPGLLDAMTIIHDVSFIVTGVMFLVHVYNGVFHPMFNESWSAITGGTISEEYAKKHYGKWFAEISGDKKQ